MFVVEGGVGDGGERELDITICRQLSTSLPPACKDDTATNNKSIL